MDLLQFLNQLLDESFDTGINVDIGILVVDA